MVNSLKSFLGILRQYFRIDCENFTVIIQKWLSIRSLVKHLDWIITAQTPRIYIFIPLNTNHKFNLSAVDSDIIETTESNDEFVDVKIEGSINSSNEYEMLGSSFHSNYRDNNNLKRNIPDIVSTISAKKTQRKRRSPSSLPLMANRDSSIEINRGFTDNDGGFYSDASARYFNSHNNSNNNSETLRKLEELQEQFSKMQKDIATFVELCQPKLVNNFNSESFGQFFKPIMTSSPSVARGGSGAQVESLRLSASMVLPPPPPCMPPPPPSTPTAWSKLKVSGDDKKKQKKILNHPVGIPDMSEVLKGLSSVKLRPIKEDANDSKLNQLVPFHISLRPVTKNECVIAAALRERFKSVRMMIDSEADCTQNISDEWGVGVQAEEHGNKSANCSYNARSLLRKVDRSQLPSVVTRDLDFDKKLS